MSKWHYPRTDLANNLLDRFAIGLTERISILAPRRKGKTQFLLKDLTPAAMDQKYSVLYASFWSNLNHPHLALLNDLRELHKKSFRKSAFTQLLNAKITSLSLELSPLARGEILFADNPESANADELSEIEHLVGSIVGSGKRKLLLILDEIQHLASESAFLPLTHALRTTLDKRHDTIKAVFSGSSRSGMNMLFSEKHAAFYQFADVMDFPDLKMDFINFMADIAEQDYRVTLDKQELWHAFKSLDASPYWFRKLLERLILGQDHTVKSALLSVSAMLATVDNYDSIWRSLKDIDKHVYIMSAYGKSLYTKESIAQLSQLLGRSITKSNIQKSITRLTQQHLLTKTVAGEYIIELPGFTDWALRKMRAQNVRGQKAEG